MKEDKKPFLLTPKEIQHILYMRELGYGKIEVVIHAKEPQFSIEIERRRMYNYKQNKSETKSEKESAIDI